MTTQLERDTLEVSCQQVLLPDASVYSVQWLDLPRRYAPLATPSLLLERYLIFLRKATCNLVQPAVTGEGVHFRLLGTPLSLLSFAAPVPEGEGEALRLGISGGLLVLPGERGRGSFSLHCMPQEGGVRLKVELTGYHPLLLGSRKPSGARKFLYRVTQAWIHKIATVRYLSGLYRDLTGVKASTTIKKVRLRDGTET